MMNYIYWMPTFLSLLFSLMAAIFMLRSAKSADSLSILQSQYESLQKRLKELEYDFGEKWDATMRKITNRQAMRARRETEESEELNKVNGGILMNGLVR